MNNKIMPLLLVSLMTSFFTPLGLASKDQKQQLEKEAHAIVKQFVGRLKPTLVNALQLGGPASAIDVCSKEAPKIAIALSAETGWSIKRVSLKPRNSSTATPDKWETEILEHFNTHQALGETATDLYASKQLENQFRFMKAQVVEGVCLNCHGASLKPKVVVALAKYYPNDTAIGYSLGQVRGAISLSKRLK